MRARDAATSPKVGQASLTIADNTVDYVQLGLGALAGIAVVGALAGASTYRHHHAHPA